MPGPDCRSLLAIAKPRPPPAIAVVVRSSTMKFEVPCAPIDPQKLAGPIIENVQYVAHGPCTDLTGQQVIPGEVKAAYQRRPQTEDTHKLDLLV
jgi:hypothetical protein